MVLLSLSQLREHAIVLLAIDLAPGEPAFQRLFWCFSRIIVTAAGICVWEQYCGERLRHIEALCLSLGHFLEPVAREEPRPLSSTQT